MLRFSFTDETKTALKIALIERSDTGELALPGVLVLDLIKLVKWTMKRSKRVSTFQCFLGNGG